MVAVEMAAVTTECIPAGFPAADIGPASKGSADIVLAAAAVVVVLLALDWRQPSALRSYDRRQPRQASGCRIFDSSSLDLCDVSLVRPDTRQESSPRRYKGSCEVGR